MEIQDDKEFLVKKERSYLSCLSNGWRLAMDHIGELLRYAWPSMLFTLILPLPGILFLAGQIDAFLSKWAEDGAMPQASRSVLRHEIIYRTKRNAISFLVILIWCILLSLASYACLRFYPNQILLWLLTCVFILILLPIEYSFMSLSYTRRPASQCLKGYSVGCRHFGTLFVFEIVGFIFMSIALLMGSMAVISTSAVWQQSVMARAQGDSVDLPILFPVIAFFAYLLMMFVIQMVFIIYSFCHCLLWGSFEAREEGRDKALLGLGEENS